MKSRRKQPKTRFTKPRRRKRRAHEFMHDPRTRNRHLQNHLIVGNEKLLQESKLKVLGVRRPIAVSQLRTMEDRRGRIIPFDKPISGASNWVELGPLAIPSVTAGSQVGPASINTIFTGRVTAICSHPTTSTTIYIGTARGGVWKTTDGGVTWTPKSDYEVSLAIGAMAIIVTPNMPDIIYAGTGEGNQGPSLPPPYFNDNWLGNGLLKSIDGGDSWTLQGGADPQTNSPGVFSGAGFFRIAVNPLTTSTVFAATSNGLFRTTNGTDWVPMTNGLPQIGTFVYPTDIVIDPSHPDTVYVGFRGGGIYQTTNGNNPNPTWTQMNLPNAPQSVFRVALGISPSSPQTVYALLDDEKGPLTQFYMTKNGGQMWSAVAFSGAPVAGNLTYCLNVGVDPTTQNIVYFSGISLYKVTYDPGTGTWTSNDLSPPHSDNHAIAFDPNLNTTIYTGTDGGLYKSTNSGGSWDYSVNKGLRITQFNSADAHPSSDAVVFGGTQDNGTMQFRNHPVLYWSDGGDGGCVAFDQTNPDNVVHANGWVTPDVLLSKQAGASGSWMGVSNGLPQVEEASSLFYPPFALDKSNSYNIAFGGDMVSLDDKLGVDGWHTKVNLPGVQSGSAGNPGELVSAVCYVNSALIYVATSLGKVYQLVKSGGTWTANPIGAPPLPARWIWDISTLPGNDKTLIVVMSGFGSDHVWQGAVQPNGMAVWTDVSGSAPNKLPDIPVYAIVTDPNAPGTYYIGTDLGVFLTTNGGTTWSTFNAGLPNSAVYDLKLHQPTRLLRAATHGRGLWEKQLDIPSMPDVNIFVRDHLMDTGRRPTPAAQAAFADPLQYVSLGDSLAWYMCADIKVDSLIGTPPAYQFPTSNIDYLAFESALQHRDPIAGSLNRVYVQLHNRGIKPTSNVTVKILYADATLGLPDLPLDFWTAFPGDSTDTSHWKPIGTAQSSVSVLPT